MMTAQKKMPCLDVYAADHGLSVQLSLYAKRRRTGSDKYQLYYHAGRHKELSNGKEIYLKVFLPKTSLTNA